MENVETRNEGLYIKPPDNIPSIAVQDMQISHAYSSSDWHKPMSFKWAFNQLVEGKDYTFLTDYFVDQTHLFPDHRKFVFLMESPGVLPDKYKYVLDNPHLYTWIFTHNRRIVEAHPDKALLTPIGGCHLSDNEICVDHHKTKLISMIFSPKRDLPGHIMRHQVYHTFRDRIDCMGSALTGVKLRKIHACQDYCFQVVIENVAEDYYFSEKLIDCLLTGTIPIFWGMPSIDKFFNTEGFLIFNTLEELEAILNSDLNKFWDDHQPEIQENFNKALEFKVAEDFLFLNYGHLL